MFKTSVKLSMDVSKTPGKDDEDVMWTFSWRKFMITARNDCPSVVLTIACYCFENSSYSAFLNIVTFASVSLRWKPPPVTSLRLSSSILLHYAKGCRTAWTHVNLDKVCHEIIQLLHARRILGKLGNVQLHYSSSRPSCICPSPATSMPSSSSSSLIFTPWCLANVD